MLDLVRSFYNNLDNVIALENGVSGIPVLDIAHALYVAREFRQPNNEWNKTSFFQQLISFWLCSLGGSTIISLILGKQALWSSDPVMMTYFIVFMLSYLLPSVFNFIVNFPIISFVISLFEDISGAIAVTTWGADKVKSPKKNSCLTLLCGFLGGCGGGLLRESFDLDKPQWSFHTPKSVSPKSTCSIWVAAFCSVIYCVGTNMVGYLAQSYISVNDAKKIIMFFMITSGSLKCCFSFIFSSPKQEEIFPHTEKKDLPAPLVKLPSVVEARVRVSSSTSALVTPVAAAVSTPASAKSSPQPSRVTISETVQHIEVTETTVTEEVAAPAPVAAPVQQQVAPAAEEQATQDVIDLDAEPEETLATRRVRRPNAGRRKTARY